MEDESKLFVAWLIKLIKINKKITGKKLAEKVGVSQPTITGYMSGRTKPNFEIRKKILKATNTDYKEMIEIGRNELRPQVVKYAEQNIDKITAQVVERLRSQQPSNDLGIYKNKKNSGHHKLVDDFEQPDLAYELNYLIREIEKKKKSKLKRIKKFLQDELLELELEEGVDGTGKLS